MGEELLARSSRRGQWTLAALILGSAISFLDGTVVNLALRTIGSQLDASLAQLQWVVNGYMLALASLVIVGGSLGDRVGRRRVYVIGITWFAVASALCGLAQTPTQLIAFRVIQGIGAAMATPGALAIISASFRPADRAAAIGTWAGTGGIAAAAGPFIGGYLVEHGGWRFIFWINVPLCVAVVWVCLRNAPESRDVRAAHHFDLVGAALTVIGLAALTEALTAGSGVRPWVVWTLAVTGVAALAGFAAYESRTDHPMVPLELFSSRVFSAANGMTFLVYGAIGALFFLLTLQLQVTSGFSPLGAGVATLPVTVAMLLLSSRAAAVSSRIGPRLPMTVGPLVCAAGCLLMAPIGAGTSYWTGVLPGMTVFALGLSALVSPLTATVLAAAPDRHVGIASGVNNAVARAGSLLAVAALPAVAGLAGADYNDAGAMTHGWRVAALTCAGLLAVGGVVSWFGLGSAVPVPPTRPAGPVARRPAIGPSCPSPDGDASAVHGSRL